MRFFRIADITGGGAATLAFLVLSLAVTGSNALAQQTPELQTTAITTGKLWLGMSANGSKTNFDPTRGFFPNDYGIAADRAQYPQAFTGAGINLTATHWFNPLTDSIENVAIYSTVTDSMPKGKVLVPLSNYVRYKFPAIQINGSQTNVAQFGTYNPSYSGFQNHTYDEVAEVVDSTILGVTMDRKVYAWSQNYNDNYVITDVVFTNAGGDTLDSLYINMQETGGNMFYSNGSNPSGQFDPTMSWQHYYGGRPGDSMRVFYEYSADNPKIAGDDMGAPQASQNGRLINPNMHYFAILHASAEPYTDSSKDADDPLQPKVTYMGVATAIQSSQISDQYGSRSFYAIRGAYSDANPMPGEITGTHHGFNNDELGTDDYTNNPGGQYEGISYRTCSFGPYTFYPGQKLHIVYASGFAGIGYELGQKIGQLWLDGTLTDPPNASQIPGWNSNTGLFPSNFQFPSGATSADKAKDRWISLGIDSVMLSAWRAKWNFDHDYNIPQAPPPPQNVSITPTAGSIQISWSDPAAEAMPGFAGYRIMRRVSNLDTVMYQPIYNSDSTDMAATHTFNDSIGYYGAQVYYYIQSKARIPYDDQNADPTTRGKIIYSGRALYPNYYFVRPTNFAQDDLSKIRIVPNPYNIRDPLLYKAEGGLGATDGRALVFYNLPQTCTIKIYTENGDLVQTIHHPTPGQTGGSETWTLLTSSQQVIYSGVYIAVFETPDGRISYQKFLVVR